MRYEDFDISDTPLSPEWRADRRRLLALYDHGTPEQIQLEIDGVQMQLNYSVEVPEGQQRPVLRPKTLASLHALLSERSQMVNFPTEPAPAEMEAVPEHSPSPPADEATSVEEPPPTKP
jgi:hypothetical protein